MPTQTINLNDATPAAPAGTQNNKWQADAASLDTSVVRNVSSYTPVFVPDTGTGGKSGAVPAPIAGDAAAGKLLSASGGFVLPPLAFGWYVPAGSALTAVGVGPILVAPRIGRLVQAKLVVKSADASTNLMVRVKRNGTSIFTVDWWIAAGTEAGTLLTNTNIVGSAIVFAADDLFSLDIVEGSASWDFTLQVE